jgi:hypothetical protein
MIYISMQYQIVHARVIWNIVLRVLNCDISSVQKEQLSLKKGGALFFL